MPATTGPKQAPPGTFPPGVSGNPAGRPKSSKHKLQESFIARLAADFEEHGESVIATARAENPAAYLKVIASILPKEVEIKRTTMDELTDDELAAGLATIRALVAQGVGEGGASPASEGESSGVH